MVERKTRKNEVRKTYFGKSMLLRKYCHRCKGMAIVIDGKCGGCGKAFDMESITRVSQKRDAVTPSKRKKPPMKIRKEILAHQNGQCLYCGVHLDSPRVTLNWDHFIPHCSGEAGERNWVASCRECNVLKSSFLFNSVEDARGYIQKRRKERVMPVFPYFGGSFSVAKI